MEVLWVSHFVPYPPKGGLLIRSHNLLTEVSKQHNVKLLALIQPRLLKSYFGSEEQGIQKSKEYFANLNIHVEFFPLISEKGALGRAKSLAKSLISHKAYSEYWLNSAKLKSTLTSDFLTNFDVVHLDTMELTQNLVAKPSCKVIVNHHNAEHSMMKRRAQTTNNIAKKLVFHNEAKKLKNLLKRNSHLVDQHICCSTEDKREIAQTASTQNVSVVPNGVSYKSRVTRNPTKGKLLFVGGLDWYPNREAIETLLENMWADISLANPQISIDIVGKNPSNKIVELVKRFSNVNLLGYIDDIQKLYEEAFLFLCPLNDGGGTKLKVLDAMNNGLPVLGSDIAFEGINISDGVNGFRANSKETYIAAISNCLEKPRSSMANIEAEARKTIKEQYNSDQIGVDYASSLNS